MDHLKAKAQLGTILIRCLCYAFLLLGPKRFFFDSDSVANQIIKGINPITVSASNCHQPLLPVS